MMRRKAWRSHLAAALLLGLIGATAAAKLPAPTPEQQKAAADKKAQAAEQQAKEKQQLNDSMDRISERWRDRAGKEGWKTHPPTPVSTQTGAPVQASQPTQAAPGQPGQPGQPAAAQTAPGQPAAQAGSTAAPPPMPIRSEKFGTAPPSADVKTNQPSGAKLDERIYKNPVEEPPHKKPEK